MDSAENKSIYKAFDANSTVPNGWPCDLWHVAGNAEFHTTDWFEEFKTICQTKLPMKTLPIYVGGTGYVETESAISLEERAWALDSMNRLVIVFDGKFMFQRYVNGGVIMIADLINGKPGLRESMRQSEVQDLQQKILAL